MEHIGEVKADHPFIAIAFAVLMVLSLVSMPVLAAGPADSPADRSGLDDSTPSTLMDPGGNGNGPPGGDGPPGHERGKAANVTMPTLDANSTVELLREARANVTDLDIDKPKSEDLRAEAIAALNASIADYRAEMFPESTAAFSSQREAYMALRQLEKHATDTQSIESTKERLLIASNVSARLATRNAYETVATYEDSFKNPGQRQRVESFLGNAGDAVARGDDAGGKQAITHYRTAWKQANKALDAVETAATPAITLNHGPAIEDDGQYNVTISVTVDDVRAYAYDTATVTFADGSTETVDLRGGHVGFRSAQGILTHDLGDSIKNTTVTVSATASHDESRHVEETLDITLTDEDIIPDRPAPDEYAEVELSDEQAGVTIEAGGDGLHETDLTIEDHTPTDDPDYLMSSVVRFTNTTAFDEATVTLSLPEETATLETQTTAVNETTGNVTTQTQSQQDPPYAIYRWDPRTEAGWEPLDTDINMDEGTATAELDGPGYLAVLDKPAWNDALTATITLEDRHFVDNETATTWDWDDNNFETDWYNPSTGTWVVNDGVARWEGSFDTKRYRTDEISQPVDERIRLSFEGKISGEWADYINIRLRNAAGEQLLRAGIGHDNYNGYGPLVEFNAATLDQRNLFTNVRLSAGEWVQTDIWYNPQAGTCRIVASGPTTSIDANISPSACEGSIAGERIESLEISGWSHSGGEQVRNVQLSVSEDGGEVPPSERTLRDTNGDGIPDAVAEANPPIEELLLDPAGRPTNDPGINIDPVAIDTSGDGIADADTIDVDYQVYKEDGELKLDAKVTNAKHHPARVDTNGDGLTDRQQVDGWEISVIESPVKAQEMMAAIDDPDVDADPAEFFSKRQTRANPFAYDTDGDGLEDAAEFEHGTDPIRGATIAADGVSDIEALENPRYDPTVFKTAPPEVTLLDHWGGWEGSSYEMGYAYIVEDPLGFSGVTLHHNHEEVVHEETDANWPNTWGFTSTFNISIFERILDKTRGFETRITAFDQVGNRLERPLYRGNDFATDLSAEHDVLGTTEAGVLSGFTDGAAELPGFVLLMARNGDEVIEAFQTFLDELDRELVIEMVKSYPDTIRAQQDQSNPKDPHGSPEENAEACNQNGWDSSEYCQFAFGWYSGYGAFAVLDIAVGAKGLGRVSTVDDLSTTLRRAADNLDDVRHRLGDGRVGQTSKVNYRLLTDGGRDLGDLDVRFPTAGKNAKAITQFEQVEGSIRRTLDSDQQTQLLRHLSDTSEGHRLVNSLGADDTARVLRADNPSAVFRTYEQLSTNRGEFIRLLRDEDVGSSLMRVVGDERIGVGNVETALKRIQTVENRGHETLRVKTARKANEDNDVPPHKKGTIVVEYKIQNPEEFVRVYGGDDPQGGWLMKESELDELSNREEVLNRFGLNTDWQDFDQVARITIGTTEDSGTIRMQISTVNSVTDTKLDRMRPGGGTQHYIKEGYVTGWEEIGPLDVFLENAQSLRRVS